MIIVVGPYSTEPAEETRTPQTGILEVWPYILIAIMVIFGVCIVILIAIVCVLRQRGRRMTVIMRKFSLFLMNTTVLNLLG